MLTTVKNKFTEGISTTSQDKIIAVTMATSRQGASVVKHLSSQGLYKIRAITRDPQSERALKLGNLKNVTLIKGDLLDKSSLARAFEGVYGIFGNTTPTKVLGMDNSYEIKQGHNLIEVIKEIRISGYLKHFIFSSVCKGKNHRPTVKVPGHFKTKWELESYINLSGLSKLTTVLRPASYFENFNSKLPGIRIRSQFFPGIVSPDCPWQTIAVDDVGLWVSTAFKYPKRFLGTSLDLAAEELTGKEMAFVLASSQEREPKKVKYFMVPRFILNIIEDDIAKMANWIEQIGYGANIDLLNQLTKEFNIKPTSLITWLEKNELNCKREDKNHFTKFIANLNLSNSNQH